MKLKQSWNAVQHFFKPPSRTSKIWKKITGRALRPKIGNLYPQSMYKKFLKSKNVFPWKKGRHTLKQKKITDVLTNVKSTVLKVLNNSDLKRKIAGYL